MVQRGRVRRLRVRRMEHLQGAPDNAAAQKKFTAAEQTSCRILFLLVFSILIFFVKNFGGKKLNTSTNFYFKK